MKKIMLTCALLSVAPLYSNILMRLGTHDDLPALLDLDRRVSYEYFVPIVTQHYADRFEPKLYIDALEKDLTNNDAKPIQKKHRSN